MKSYRDFGHALRGDRRGVALIMVMLIVSTLMIIGILFSSSVTAEYRASIYYRQAVQSEQYCVVGLQRAMAELMYEVWGVNEDRPFVPARYNPNCSDPPIDNLLSLGANAASDFGGDGSSSPVVLGKAAYYESSTGSLLPIIRQNGHWNGEGWAVWAGRDQGPIFASSGDPEVDGNVWNMDPRPTTRQEMIGGAQRYQSFGDGTVEVTNGSAVVTGTGTNFDTGWPNGTGMSIGGVACVISSVASTTSLTLQSSWGGATASGLGYACKGVASASKAGAVAGGPQALAAFAGPGIGYPANPRWVNPEAFVSFYNAGPFVYGGVDLNGDGMVNETDKNLRNWALWKLKCDAFLPRAMSNNDAFEAQMHANNRLAFPNTVGSKDAGFEVLSPFIVGDAHYQIFRSDPIYTMYNTISGEASVSTTNLAQKSDQTGYRYPYDRTHVGKASAVTMANDLAGGLVNINQVNNNYNVEEWTGAVGGGATPGSLSWYHINESKWIYCYDPLDAGRRYGRYAVTLSPDCATWNAASLHSGIPDVHVTNYSSPVTKTTGSIRAAGGMMWAIRSGFNPQTGDSAGAALLQSVAVCYAPIRPSPLPLNWSNQGTDGGATYFCPDGVPDSSGVESRVIPTDRTRAPEIAGGHGGSAWDGTTGTRSAIFNYLMWLGPYDSRAELATHLRKAGLTIPYPAYDGYPNHTGLVAALRRCMETEMNARQTDVDKVASDAKMIAALTTVHGYYYTLDRFWDRDLTFIDWSAGTSGSATDARFDTAQCTAAAPATVNAAGALPGQRTRNRLLRDLNNLECFGGYRTRDGKYRLLDYLFQGDTAPVDYTNYLSSNPPSTTASDSYTPASYGLSPVYGGATGTLGAPASWGNQKVASRREKFMATVASRIGSAQRGSGITAACPNGHLVHSPELNASLKPVWGGVTKSKSLRNSAADVCHDEIGAGCPVCGGKLFLAPIYEVSINEVGRFYGKFRTAERPVRQAWDVASGDGAKRPMRHFVELLVSGRYQSYGATEKLVRFDQLKYSDAIDALWNTPAILSDPVTGKPYFSYDLEFDQRWRSPADPAAANYTEGMDPEPIFRGLPPKGGGDSPSADPDLHILVYDDNDNGGRWHDVTWAIGNDYNIYGSYYHAVNSMTADPQLYNRSFYTDDTGTDPSKWASRPLRCDEYYSIPDPDPAHQQQQVDNTFIPAQPPLAGQVFVEDSTPGGATGAEDGWTWVAANPAPQSGIASHQSKILPGMHQHYFTAGGPWTIPTGSVLYTYVYIDPANLPTEIMLQFYAAGSWEHRAYWGANNITWGTDGTASRRGMGVLPAAGAWVKLTIPASTVGLEGLSLTGMAYVTFDGRATWDKSGREDFAGSPAISGVNNAYVNIYRKMPVRWAGGDRRQAYNLHYYLAHGYVNEPLGFNWNDAAPRTAPVIRSRRGLAFDECMILSNLRQYSNQGYHDYLYAGDTAWLAAGVPPMANDTAANAAAFAGKLRSSEWPAFQYKDPGQYAVVSFDSKFDGSKVAVVFGSPNSGMPNYSGYRIVSYVELTDSVGAPQRISTTCTTEGNTNLSWQARNPRDIRGNADGYMLWDLLPMTLNGDILAGTNDPLSTSVGYDPWWITAYGAGCTWWCAGDDGFTSQADPQAMPTGYADLITMSCKNRNANMWNMNFPVRRATFDGTTATSKDAQEGVHESIVRTMHDRCLIGTSYGYSSRAHAIKEHSMSIPTGIGRQVADADATDTAKATYGGRQYGLGGSWHEGNATVDAKQKWSGYSWSSWYKLHDVTDLCQNLLWDCRGDYDTGSMEDVDLYDANQNGLRDEKATTSTAYVWSNGGAATTVASVSGHFIGELRQINKLNLNDMWFPPTFSGVSWNQSYTSFGRKPLKGFHAASDSMTRHYVGADPGYNLRVRPWDLDNCSSLQGQQNLDAGNYYNRFDSAHCGTSPVYTIYVTGNALDEQAEPLAEMRLRATVERTWDGRCNILEFCWLTVDSGFMGQ